MMRCLFNLMDFVNGKSKEFAFEFFTFFSCSVVTEIGLRQEQQKFF